MSTQIIYSDFPKICRFCMEERNFINILDRPDLIYIYMTITNISIKHNDCFPKNICLDCVNNLEVITKFIEVCKQSHDYLTAIILDQDDKLITHENNENGSIPDGTIFDNEENTENEDDFLHSDQEDNKLLIMEEIKNIQIKSEIVNNVVPQIKNNNTECDKCKKVFYTTKLLKIHMSIHKGKKWRCFKCSKEFSKKNDLRRHLRIHTGSRPFECAICSIKFTQKSTLNRHIGAVHIMDDQRKYKFECFICEKKFNRKDHLEAHMINCHIKKIDEHYIENPNQKFCTVCGKSFSLFSYMKQHETIHLAKDVKKNSYKLPPSSSNLCSICGKSYEKRPAFLQHMKRIHGPPLPKKAREKKPLKKSGDKHRFQCWQCGKTKASLCNLKAHMRIHTGEKPYMCKFCYKTFSAWNSWHDHENIHLDLKPYQCEHCEKMFRQRSSLRKHLRSSAHINQNKHNAEGKPLVL